MSNGKKQLNPHLGFAHYPLPISHYLIAAALAIALGGCGTTPPRPGGYYLDDGPGASPPANLDSVPDAVPRVEPINRGTSRPYVVMGRSYTPMTAHAPYKARGIATWYGRRYHGKPTSSGEPYDMYAMTAAHTTLPIPSYVRVTHLKNGRSVVVRVNDRGPFVDGRIIDLSYTAAHKLGVLAGGNAMVEVEAIIPGGGGAEVAAIETRLPQPAHQAGAATETPPPDLEPRTIVARSFPGAAAGVPPVELPPSRAPTAASASTAAGGSGYYVQLGAFGSRENAEDFLARMKARMDWLSSMLHIFTRDGLYRVHAGPYAREAEARRDADRVSQALGIKSMVFIR